MSALLALTQRPPPVAEAACDTLGCLLDRCVEAQRALAASGGLGDLAQLIGRHSESATDVEKLLAADRVGREAERGVAQGGVLVVGDSGAGVMPARAAKGDDGSGAVSSDDLSLSEREIALAARRIDADRVPDRVRRAACRALAVFAQSDEGCKEELATIGALPALLALAVRGGEMAGTALGTLSAALADSQRNQHVVALLGGVDLLVTVLRSEGTLPPTQALPSHSLLPQRSTACVSGIEGRAISLRSRGSSSVAASALWCLVTLVQGSTRRAHQLWSALDGSVAPLLGCLSTFTSSATSPADATATSPDGSSTAEDWSNTARHHPHDRPTACALATVVGLLASHGLVETCPPTPSELSPLIGLLHAAADSAANAALIALLQLLRTAGAHPTSATSTLASVLRVMMVHGGVGALVRLLGVAGEADGGDGGVVMGGGTSGGPCSEGLMPAAVAHNAAVLVAHLAANHPEIRPALHAAGLMSQLAGAIAQPDVLAGSATAGPTLLAALATLAAVDPAARDEAEAAGIFHPLLVLISSSSPHPLQPLALQAISNLAARHPPNRGTLRDLGAIRTLVELLHPRTPEDVRMLAAHTLMHLAACHKANQTAIALEGGIVALVALDAHMNAHPAPASPQPHNPQRSSLIERVLFEVTLDNPFVGAALREARRAVACGALAFNRPHEWHRFQASLRHKLGSIEPPPPLQGHAFPVSAAA
mmetsp:Transcript_65153/g.128866  ORF Transcript_65153/g.128866 Transcript_65153/m.128866 type:complete len:712 (-) Transcript_65153:69-2204(-)